MIAKLSTKSDQAFGNRRLNRWWHQLADRREVSFETLGQIAVISLGDGAPGKYRRSLLRAVCDLPTQCNRLIVDVSRVNGRDLPKLAYLLAHEANQYQVELCLAGISREKRALLEITRITRIVPCFEGRREAICSLMMEQAGEEVSVS